MVHVGAGAVILPRLIIVEGAIIGAGAIVTKDVESYTVVVGNPAKVLKNKNKQNGSKTHGIGSDDYL